MIPVQARDRYMAALEAASVGKDIVPFTSFLAEHIGRPPPDDPLSGPAKAKLAGRPRCASTPKGDIPLDLLEARDCGEVVCFWRGGRVHAGLPSFRQLARKVVADLGVPIGDKRQNHPFRRQSDRA